MKLSSVPRRRARPAVAGVRGGAAALRVRLLRGLRQGLLSFVGACCGSAAFGQAAPHEPLGSARLAELSLEQLREVVVSTVSRAEERLDRVAASVYVISADDLRRSGATTLPEALRLAPTLWVGRADANQYAISARGFDNVLANKMLVLIDGRTLYTPLFSGVFWEAQDVMLEDVERIEVITGPSTALWGSNAVNGLVHVITRHAGATHGAFAAVQAGNFERTAALRLGGASGRLDWRGYVKGYQRDGSSRADGSAIGEDARGAQVGARADWRHGTDSASLQADAYQGRIDQAVGPGRRFSGANVTSHWQREHDDGAQTRVQLVVDHTERVQPGNVTDRLDTIDLVAQYSAIGGDDHRVVMGGGLRHALDRTTGTAALAFVPADRSLTWQRLFAQDQWRLTPTLALTLAASLERNPYTGSEFLPSARLAWTGWEGGLLWASLSRAVRAPSRVDRELYSPARPPHLLAGGPTFQPELSNVLEAGWRGQGGPRWSYAVTAFHTEHRQLRSLAPTPAGAEWRNDIEGHSRGLESWLRWRALPRWQIDGGLAWQRHTLRVRPGGIDVGGLSLLGNPPRQQAQLRSSLEVGSGWRWDADLRRVGARAAPAVPAYTAVDTRLAWAPRPKTEITVGVQNLFDPRHAEWGVPTNRVEFERAFFVRLRLWQ